MTTVPKSADVSFLAPVSRDLGNGLSAPSSYDGGNVVFMAVQTERQCFVRDPPQLSPDSDHNSAKHQKGYTSYEDPCGSHSLY